MSRRSAAFTLIELLVVLIIIGIVISITLPALGGARRAARRSATEGMLRQITNAAAHFQTDNRRLPGHFTARDMAHQLNQTNGFSAMHNVMWELAGIASGTTMVGPGGPSPNGPVQEGVDVATFGLPGQSNTKAYWIPDARHLVAQDTTGQQVATPENRSLPSVIDEFSNPVLAWVVDDTAIGKVKTVDPTAPGVAFARVDSNTNPAPALFYWTPNSCFLGAPSLGRRGYNQLAVPNTSDGSAIGLGAPVAEIPKSLAGILGNGNAPYKNPQQVQQNLPFDVPSAPRYPFMLQSAGADGIYVAKKDRGFKQFKFGFIDYRATFAPTVDAAISATNQWTDKNEKGTNIDIMAKFDDILVGGGN